jgi:hypothetical protein
LKNPIRKTECSKNNLWISPFFAATLSTAALVGIDLATPCTPVCTNHKRIILGMYRIGRASVAESGMFIPDSGSEFFPSRNPDLGSASKNLSILI